MSLPSNRNEEINYNCLRKMITHVVREGLRMIFKQEWNIRYQTKTGAWDDTEASGMSLFNLENARSRAGNYLSKFLNGNTREWDCSVLCDAILSSNAIGKAGLNRRINEAVNNLRKLRNKISHELKGEVSGHQFDDLSRQIRSSLLSLGLSVKQLDQIKMERKRFASFQVLPAHPTHDVVSRQDTVSSINDELHNLFSKSDGKLTYLYISGNPGSGKSQLARKIGESHYNNIMKKQNELVFVMTLNAKSLDTLLGSYEDFAYRLICSENVIINIINSKETSPEAKIRQLRTQIATKIKNYKSWLIIVDNVEELQLVSSLLPQLKDEEWSNGQVLITTQDSLSIPLNTSFTTHFSVSKGMTEAESCRLLATLSGTGDHTILTNVAKQLDYQPLALAAAAVYVKQVIATKASPEFSWHDYLNKLKQGKRQLTEKQLCVINSAYSLTMTSAVLLAVKTAAKDDKVLSNVFRFLSLVSRDSLPSDIALNYVRLCNKDIDEDDVCVKIQKCSLILTERQETVVFIRLHRVVHEALKVYALKYEDKEIVAAARSLYLFKERKDERILVPHLKAFYAAATSLSSKNFFRILSPNIMKMLLYFGKTLVDYGELSVSKHFLVEALDLSTKIYNADDINVALCYNYQGNLYFKLGDFQQAKQYNKLALEIRLKQLGSDNTNVATSYGNLGNVYRGLGDLQQAKQYYELALEIFLKKSSSDHIDVAATYVNLGNVYRELGDLQQAKYYNKLGLEIGLKHLGSDHIHVGAAYSNLGKVYCNLGNLQQAKKYCELALEIRLKQLGSNHTDVAISYNSLGNVYYHLGYLQLAKQYYELALEILLKQLGSDNIDVAATYINLGNVFRDLGDLQQAKQYNELALEIGLKHLGSNHTNVATSYINLGNVCHDLGNFQQARQYCKLALEIFVKQLGSNHTSVAASYNSLGNVYCHLGYLQQAKQYYELALEIFLEQLGSDHISVATSYHNLGNVYHDLGDFQQAKQYYKLALEIFLQQLGSNHTSVAASYRNLSTVYRDLGDLKQGNHYYELSREIHSKRLGSDHVHVARCSNNLEEHIALGDINTRKQFHEKHLDIHKKKLGSNHPCTTGSHENLCREYDELSDLHPKKKRRVSNQPDTAISYENLPWMLRADRPFD